MVELASAMSGQKQNRLATKAEAPATHVTEVRGSQQTVGMGFLHLPARKLGARAG